MGKLRNKLLTAFDRSFFTFSRRLKLLAHYVKAFGKRTEYIIPVHFKGRIKISRRYSDRKAFQLAKRLYNALPEKYKISHRDKKHNACHAAYHLRVPYIIDTLLFRIVVMNYELAHNISTADNITDYIKISRSGRDRTGYSLLGITEQPAVIVYDSIVEILTALGKNSIFSGDVLPLFL